MENEILIIIIGVVIAFYFTQYGEKLLFIV